MQRLPKKPTPISLSRMPSRPPLHSKQFQKQFQQQQQINNLPQSHIQYDVDPSLVNKKTQIFLTQKNISQVQLAHNQLNAYIDILDDKVTRLVQRNQAQFLVAYRNHIKKVRQQMEQIRRKALCNANSTISQTQKIQALQKQLMIFREQSLKLFQKVSDKQRIISSLQNKLSELQSQKNHLQNRVKTLTKRNKYLEGHKNEQSTQNKFEIQSNHDSKQFQIIRPQNQPNTCNISNKQKIYYDPHRLHSKSKRPNTTDTHTKVPSNQSLHFTTSKTNDIVSQLQQIYSKIDQILSNQVNFKIINHLKQSIDDIFKINQPNNFIKSHQIDFNRTIRSNKSNYIKYRFHKTYINNAKQKKQQIKKFQMEQFFVKCVETVKKQINRRNGQKNLNFYSNLHLFSLQEFKKVDFFRLLEIVLNNDHILDTLYNTLFNSYTNK